MDRLTFLKILALGTAIPADARRLLGRVGIKRVTDPLKRVTDSALLSHLGKHGIDKDYVEFVQDYAARGPGRSPYSKRYKDKKSGRQFYVNKSLPMCRADGTKLTPGWEQGIKKFIARTNLFEGEIDNSGRIALSPTNDQPGGMLISDLLVWQPQLFLGGVEVKPIRRPLLLPFDPWNPNYRNNVIEWDYGICKRLIRTIEGRLFERWVFTSNPGADVRIVHNRIGKGPFSLGQYSINEDVEFIPLAVFQQAEYPFIVSAGGTFYPDKDPENTSVDGGVQRHNVAEAWATIKAGAGSGFWDSLTNHDLVGIESNTNPNWKSLRRAITIFDASAASGNVKATSLSFYGDSKADACGIAPVSNVYSADPAHNDEIIAADFTTLGTTPFCDTNITYAAFSTAAGYNNVFDFNAAGIAAIQAALDGDGIVKLGQREALYDVGAGTPTHPGLGGLWTQMRAYSADQGEGFEPKLVIEVSAGIAVIVDTKDVAADLEEIDGVGVADIEAIDGKP